MFKVGIISLGCAKNRVDSEQIMAFLDKNEFEFVLDPNAADIIIINTCGFIDDAKQESIDTIFEMLEYKKILVVTGCLVERYKEVLEKEIGEVDLYVSISDYPRFNELLSNVINKKLNGEIIRGDRYLSTEPYTAFLKISEGCNNRCHYCAIPLIRGGFRSFPFFELIEEAKKIASLGVKELVVISQDTTRYGEDLSPKRDIVELLKELLKIEEFAYIRLLYLYPDEISDELIELIAKEERLTPYFDIPIQHSEDNVLLSMNRRGNKEFLINLFKKIREKVPNAILRTTLIVGYPSESKSDFEALCEFIKEVEFDHLGVFTYSPEEGTVGATLKQITKRIKEARKEKIMQIQSEISLRRNQRFLNEKMHGIVTGFDEEKGAYTVRNFFNAPDEIDGNIYVYAVSLYELGETINFKVVDVSTYDLYCEEL